MSVNSFGLSALLVMLLFYSGSMHAQHIRMVDSEAEKILLYQVHNELEGVHVVREMCFEYENGKIADEGERYKEYVFSNSGDLLEKTKFAYIKDKSHYVYYWTFEYDLANRPIRTTQASTYENNLIYMEDYNYSQNGRKIEITGYHQQDTAIIRKIIKERYKKGKEELEIRYEVKTKEKYLYFSKYDKKGQLTDVTVYRQEEVEIFEPLNNNESKLKDSREKEISRMIEPIYISRWEYDKEGRLLTLNSQNTGDSSTSYITYYSYDNMQRLISCETKGKNNETRDRYDFSYDEKGRISKVVRYWPHNEPRTEFRYEYEYYK